MSSILSANRQVYAKIRTASVSRNMGIIIKKARNTGDADSGSILVWLGGGGLYLYVFDNGAYNLLSTTVGITMNPNVWYEIKAQLFGRTVRAKVWALGTSEPDWQNTAYINRMQIRGMEPSGPTTIALRPDNDAVAKDFADLRITPIRKVGGP